MQPTLQALLVDDEPSALLALQGMLAEYCPQVKVLGTANNVNEAFKFCQQQSPNLVFLDIEMPPLGDGFDFLRLMQPNHFGVIFTTAYPNYALRSIQAAQPWGYLVKPFEPTELIASVQTAQQKLSVQPPALLRRQGLVVNDTRRGNVAIRFADILYLAADNATVDVFVRRQNQDLRYTLYRSLKEFEQELPKTDFFRIHRRYIVNFAWIERYERNGRNGLIHLATGAKVEVSVQKMEDFALHFEAYLRGQ